MQLVSFFGVTMGDLCPTHGTLAIHLQLSAPSYKFQKLRSPRPLEELVQNHVTFLYGPPQHTQH